MKRTGWRWVSKENLAHLTHGDLRMAIALVTRGSDRTNNATYITITYDDGEPEGKCPCANREESRCCQSRGNIDRPCCVCHTTCGSDVPCLSDFHKKPATGDVAIEGFTNREHQGFQPLGSPYLKEPEWAIPATLIIHEPVKEMTLLETVDAYINQHNRLTPDAALLEHTFNKMELALKAAREKGEGTKEGME